MSKLIRILWSSNHKISLSNKKPKVEVSPLKLSKIVNPSEKLEKEKKTLRPKKNLTKKRTQITTALLTGHLLPTKQTTPP